MSFASSRPAASSPRPARGRRGPLLPTIGVLAGVVIAFLVMSRFWTEWLWFDQVGYSNVLLTQWSTRGGLFVVGLLLMGGVVWFNLRLAYKNRPMYVPTTPQQRDLDRYREAFEPLRRLAFIAAPIVVGFFAGSAAATQWQPMLEAFNGQPFGQVDPQFGLDIGFYVFTLPFLRFVISFLLWTTIFGLAAAAFVHYLYGGIQVTGQRRAEKPARIQLSILGGLVVLLVGVNYWLDRYTLLNSPGERFDGATYTEVNAVLPARWILAFACVFVAVLIFAFGARGRWRLPVVGLGLAVVTGLVAGMAIPAITQAVVVSPNEQDNEAEFIQRNIDATLAAYGLEDVETQVYEAELEGVAGALADDEESTAQIRLLDPNIVSPTFRQDQQNRHYYTFPETLNVDRYQIDGELNDTVIAVRDINLDAVAQRNWTNDHTVFTHGFGVVAAYGNTTTNDGRPQFFEGGIPSIGALGDYEPRIYFSENSPDYSIVGAPEGADPWELDYPDDDAEGGQVNNTYEGDGGPGIGNVWRQLLYAARFGSEQIIFSDRVNSESQILYHRDPRERVARVAPFLTLDGRTYPAVADTDGDGMKEVVWVVDAYTTSDDYPYSERQQLEDATIDALTGPDGQAIQAQLPELVNYIRNSVKAVVSAYDGSVTLYAWDMEDPILQTWMEIFPDMIQPMSDISGDLMSHLRYPEDLFKVQRELLNRYHVTDARNFFSGGDFWRTPPDPAEPQFNQPPFYLSLRMPEQEEATFSLTTSFILNDDQRNVLTGFMAVNSETGDQDGEVHEDYGTIRLLELPRDLTVPGPGQVQNDFNTDTTAATELNILSSGGSQVLSGNLLTLPVGGGLLYVQPVYVQSESGTQFPLLRRVLVAFGDSVGFAHTLDEALDQVFEGDAGAAAGDADVVPVPDDEVDLDAEDIDTDGEPVDPDATDPDDEPTETETETADPPATDPGDGDAQARLNRALADAREAMEDSNEALVDSDWAAYGEAQERLADALERALEADEELNG
ncbi:UPF0182 family protein [Pseudactinotalea sp. Z1739]|uniref:UPF0182 family membrane protein n=1 Tax=Pseudactinotalea sp. Z1739 TaxID=3413028 RepID=UPI003C79E809